MKKVTREFDEYVSPAHVMVINTLNNAFPTFKYVDGFTNKQTHMHARFHRHT